MALKSNLSKIARDLPQTLDDAVRATAEGVDDVRREYVPVDEGDLRDSGKVIPQGNAAYTVEEGDGLAYAPFVEYGTEKMQAQPHMTPAAEAGKSALRQNIVNGVNDTVSKYGI